MSAKEVLRYWNEEGKFQLILKKVIIQGIFKTF